MAMAASEGGYQATAAPKMTFSKDAPAFVPKVPIQEEAGYEDLLRGGYWSEEYGKWWVPYYVGKLKSFNVRTGFGFLECEQTFTIYKVDVYIHKNQVPVPWKVGQHVEFAVKTNSRGQPQAESVNWLPLHLIPKLVDPKAASSQTNTAAEADVSTPSAPLTLPRYIGSLKSYSTTQGYGFLTSDDIQDKHACDVYLDRGQLPAEEWRPGQVVEFEVDYNKRGQPQARNVNWDPVPALQQGNVVRANLGMVGNIDSQVTRNLGKVLNFLRGGDKSNAVRTAVDLASNVPVPAPADTVDYLAFVCDRIGSPSRATADELAEAGVASMLLVALSNQLKTSGSQVINEHIVDALFWCENLVPTLRASDDSQGAASFDNVISLVRGNVEAAATTSQDGATHAAVLAALAAVQNAP